MKFLVLAHVRYAVGSPFLRATAMPRGDARNTV